MGGVIHSIPVENSSMNAELDKGIVVQIEGKAGEWLFVSHNKIAGWCTQDSVISVK
jgi:SH3-like domain-containing protein